ncbi:uncharacterized protein E0L32_000504 [Thyridium curvatum]|uniref:PNPLA domain-containing protein n=1 Tax=Thyridium curvatum TaxID=1093900 RepID=A0A507BBX0_9PEZI|nr:uncharacterized protein E0L32_000504 [Thyridium curvatum]TPX14110.1 hypothetical protein E0L32_000504 [Thyridium curvatum]
MATSAPLKILSLDGGGIRGLSSLLILECIMEKMRESKGLSDMPRPCEVFDLIGGTSTGGIIAIMLGRLKMTVNECIQAYRKLAEQAFTPKKGRIPYSSHGAFSATALEDAIKQAIRESCVEAECVAQRTRGDSTEKTCPHSEMKFRDKSCTKTVVLAITKDDVDTSPTLFTTYGTSMDLDSCAIWQVARATSAATTFFKPITIGRDKIEYIDAAFGYNNPCEILIEEAQRQWPGAQELRILSIGTGLGNAVKLDNSRVSIVKALKKMATSSQRVASSLANRYSGSNQYHRFNVDSGMEDVVLSDWKKASAISSHTKSYIRSQDRALQEFVDKLDQTSIPPVPSTPESTKQSRPTSSAYHFPFPRNRRFVGREQVLAELQDRLFALHTPCVSLVGLGGVGKTQVALELAYWVKENHPDHCVFWVSALSDATFEQSYSGIAKKLLITQRICGDEKEDVKVIVQQHLSSSAVQPWFLIVDNADDRDLVFGPSDSQGGISQYLPTSEAGVTLFTTRSREVAVDAAQGEIVDLCEMEEDEAAGLFARLLVQHDLGKTEPALELLKELTYLPLAISQAAAYLNKNINVSIPEYLALLRGTEQDLVSLMSKEFRDSTRYANSQNAVATTWIVSFEHIRKANEFAASLLSFISCIEPKAIPQSILPRSETQEQLASALGLLCGYAFLTRRGDTDLYDMHSLVHTATRVWIQDQAKTDGTRVDAIRCVVDNFPRRWSRQREQWLGFLPHAISLLRRSENIEVEERLDLLDFVIRCLTLDGRWLDVVHLFEGFTTSRQGLPAGEAHPHHSLDRSLGRVYSGIGQHTKAISYLETAVLAYRRQRGEDDVELLAAELDLAEVHIGARNYSNAIAIIENILANSTDILKASPTLLLRSHALLVRAHGRAGQATNATDTLQHILGVLKPTARRDGLESDILSAERSLAEIYINNNQPDRAVRLLKYVMDDDAILLPEDAFTKLHSQYWLGKAYVAVKDYEQAIDVLEPVVKISARTIGEEHILRLILEHCLATAYLEDGQVARARELFEHVVDVHARTCAAEDTYRLSSEYFLARTYVKLGEMGKACNLLEHVVATHTRISDEEDKFRLESECYLAQTYRKLGQLGKACQLLEHVVATFTRILDEESKSRLWSEYYLARTYLELRELEKACQLLEHVAATYAKILDEEDETRLKSEFRLAQTYLGLGQLDMAIGLFEHVAMVDAKTLELDDPDRLMNLEWLEHARGQIPSNQEI